jgi:Protein of unknown function (DUF3313)
MPNKFWSTILACLGLIAAPLAAMAQDDTDSSFDGLVQVEDSQADAAYVLPEADFSGYDSFIIIEPAVAFRKNWQRDFNRQSAQRRITDDDMERIMDGMKELFLEVFTDELEEAGYPIVQEPGDNVMILRPAIIDLDVAAPDIPSAGRTRSYTTSAGSAGLYIEFYDSVTAQILARVVDYKRARDTGTFQWSSSVSNRAEARAVLRRWARMLVDRLDEIHGN